MNGACNVKLFFWPAPWGPGEGSKGQISFNFNNKVNFKDFYTKLCVCSHKWKIQNISDGIFILSPGSCPRCGTFGRWGAQRSFFKNMVMWHIKSTGRVAQSVTCLATDACLTADPGVASSILARYHTFVEIDHEIISTVILLPSADLFKKGCCQLQAKVCAQVTGNPLAQACPAKSVVKWTDRPAMTIAVDMGRKATKTNKQKTGMTSRTECKYNFHPRVR